MKHNNRKFTLALLAVPMLLTLGAIQASAQPLSLRLHRSTLNNVTDAAGLWQHEGGTVTTLLGVPWGNYAVTRRVTAGGTTAQNTAMVTVTLFRNGGSPPENITLQGSHSYSSGVYVGSVSAASTLFSTRRNHTFAGNTATGLLVIQ